jgi:hypothetical protein
VPAVTVSIDNEAARAQTAAAAETTSTLAEVPGSGNQHGPPAVPVSVCIKPNL